MGMFVWIIFGIFAGWVASLTIHSDEEQGTMADMLLGVVGALLGGFLVSFFAESGMLGSNMYHFLITLLSATVLIFMGRLLHQGPPLSK